MILRRLCAVVLLALLATSGYGQAIGDYRTNQTGNWSNTNTWERYDGTSWVNPAPSVPINTSGVITIRHDVGLAINGTRTVDQLVINSGATLTLGPKENLIISDGTGTDLTLNGSIVLTPGTGGGNSASLTLNGSTIVGNGGAIITSNAGNTSTITINNGAALDINSGGSLVLVSGASLVTTGTLTSNGTITIAGGTLTGAGTRTFGATSLVEYSATAAQNVYPQAYGHLTISGSGIKTLQSGTTSIAGNLTIVSGTTFAAGTNNFSIQGNWINSGGFTASGAQTVTFNGTSAQQEIGSTNSTETTFNNLTINQNSATPPGVILYVPATVNGALTFTKGCVILGPNNFTFGSSATHSGAAANTGALVTNSTGFARRNIAAGASFVFPVAAVCESYSPATVALTGGSTADIFSVSVKDASVSSWPSYSANWAAAPISPALVQLQWMVNEAVANGSNATLTFQWNTADENSSVSPNFDRTSTVYISRFNGSSWVETSTGGGAVLVSGSDYSATAAGFTSFSPFGVGNIGALPVELTSFSAQRIDGRVELRWATATELNNRGFEIERSTDRSTWLKIGFVDGQGNSNAPKRYAFTDEQPISGMSYYRLRQMDRDGTADYSPIVEVSAGITPATTELYTPYPNPATGNSTVSFYLPVEQYVSLAVYDLGGREVARVIEGASLSAGTHAYPVALGGLSTGNYIVRLTAGGLVLSRTVTLSR